MEVFRLKKRPFYHITEPGRTNSLCGSGEKNRVTYIHNAMRIVEEKDGISIKEFDGDLLCQVCVSHAYNQGYIKVTPIEGAFPTTEAE